MGTASNSIRPSSFRLSSVPNDEEESAKQYADTEIVKYIGSTFKKRSCNRYVPKKDSQLCGGCGYTGSVHKQNGNKIDITRTWDVKTDTLLSPTDAFGEVKFAGQKTCKYIRVDYKTSVTELLNLMEKHWLMEMPRLLISVTGGAQNFTMKPRLKEVFRQGLVKAAESTGAWIITGGTNAGVMKHVGEAIRDHTIKYGSKKQLVALGIATWGCIENKEKLIGKTCPDKESFVGCWPASYETEVSSQKKKESPLDPNHTHFILVDNGTQQMFGVEIELRANLESEIAKMKTKEESVAIPIVCVVLEGGPNTLETVQKAIDTGTPAIIVEGSGRAADILAYAYSRCKEVDVEIEVEGRKQKHTIALYDDELWVEVAERIEKEFNKKDPKDVQKSVKLVRSCIDKIDHMTVFRLDGGSSAKDIDITIIRALLKVNRGKRIDQLRLALAWDRVDIAKEDIFTDGVQFEKSDLQDLMFSAIVHNRVDFVKLFLEKSINLEDFLTIDRFYKLYNHEMTKDRCHQLQRRAKKKEKIAPKHVGMLIRDLTGQLFEPEYCSKQFRHDQYGLEQQQRQSGQGRESVTLVLRAIDPLAKETTVRFDDPARHLFLWSILTQRKDMAMVFWYEAKEDTALAVIAHLMLKNLLEKESDPEIAVELQEQVNHYEALATGLLSECYSSDQQKAKRLLVREMPSFGNTTTLKMAVQGDNMNFVAHQACQSLLTEIWMGKLSDDNHYTRLLISVFIPLLAPLLLKFREKEQHQDPDSEVKWQTKRVSAAPAQLTRNGSQTELLNGNTFKKIARNPSTSPNLTYFEKMIIFFSAPLIKFGYNCIAYMAFLMLFGIILLTDFYPTIGIKEEILIAWVVTLIFEEIRQIAMDDASDVSRKLYNYINDIWNIVDVITIVTFLAGMILRFIPVSTCGHCFYAARIILALNFMTFFFRILHMFSIHRELGPKLVMIGKMMIDLFYFMIILLVFIAAYGIASHVILYPNQPLNIVLARDVLSQSWWTLFGELGLDGVTGNSCTDKETALKAAEECASLDYTDFRTEQCADYKDSNCPSIDWLVPIILAIYALVTNVLMLNLLIAMFSNTFSNIQGQTNIVWRMQRYHLIREYYSRPILPPPLIVVSHIFHLTRFVVRRCNCCPKSKLFSKNTSALGFRMTFENPTKEKELLNWENVNAEEFIRKRESKEEENADNKAQETSERVDVILRKVEEIAETNFLIHSSDASVQPQLPPLLSERLQYLEKQMQRTSKALDWIIANIASTKTPLKLPDVDEEIEEAKKKKVPTATLR